jgi:orotidine-5'-phosphate decarboxylase
MTMGYLELLKQSAEERRSVVCFGLDPDLDRIPAKAGDGNEKRIVDYFMRIIDAALLENRSISALKPNYAYFAQYGFEGLRALKTLIDAYRGRLPIIFDAKRGDIGKSSEAYAKEAFDFWGADAVTVSPYMGYDSVEPFLKRCKAGKGAYVLCRTSNPGAADFQSKSLENGKPLFIEVAKALEKWHTPGIGAVIGATDVDELEAASWSFYDSGKQIAFLVPGVGTQGGSARETAKALKSVWQEALVYHRINSSSGIAYAGAKEEGSDRIGAAMKEIAKLNAETGF